MDIDIIAELRFVAKDKMADLEQALQPRPYQKRKLFGLLTKTAYEDVFEEFVEKSTSLHDSFEAEGFLYLFDMANMFNDKYRIDLTDEKYMPLIAKLLKREEYARFIDFDYKEVILPKLEAITVPTDMLQRYNEFIGFENDDERIQHQLSEINRVVEAIRKVTPDTVLYLRGESI